MRKFLTLSWIIVVIALIISLVFYGQMPERVDSHWNEKGQVNGTMSRFWGLFLLPLMMAGLNVLMVALPKMDPLNPNFTGFKQSYYAFILAFNVFMLLVHIYMVLWNAQIVRFSPNPMISLSTGLLIYAAGIMVKSAKRNWFAGIRTPWTLSSDVVWDKTHHLGSYLFKIGGILIFLSIFVPSLTVWIVLSTSLGVSLITVIYSYIVYRQEQKRQVT